MEPIKFNTKIYSKGFKLIQLRSTQKPKGFIEWFYLIWGFDIFFHKVPFLKSIVLANIIVWLICN